MDSKNLTDELKNISIRGRMAYLLCSFENLLLYYDCDKDEWKPVLEKLWAYTKMEYLDDWMYEIAEYLPNSILEDTMEDAEYITEIEIHTLYKLYNKTSQEIQSFLSIIYECGTHELYGRLCDNSPDTLKLVEEARNILKTQNINLLDFSDFKKYTYQECGGWGTCFEGSLLSKFI